jgi:hypothetical protein
MATVSQQPIRFWQTVQKGRRTYVIADLACGHE